MSVVRSDIQRWADGLEQALVEYRARIPNEDSHAPMAEAFGYTEGSVSRLQAMLAGWCFGCHLAADDARWKERQRKSLEAIDEFEKQHNCIAKVHSEPEGIKTAQTALEGALSEGTGNRPGIDVSGAGVPSRSF
jgi:hypothetical protein